MTQFAELYGDCPYCENGWVVCPECGGEWVGDSEDSECRNCVDARIICPKCGGSGEVVTW